MLTWRLKLFTGVLSKYVIKICLTVYFSLLVKKQGPDLRDGYPRETGSSIDPGMPSASR